MTRPSKAAVILPLVLGIDGAGAWTWGHVIVAGVLWALGLVAMILVWQAPVYSDGEDSDLEALMDATREEPHPDFSQWERELTS